MELYFFTGIFIITATAIALWRRDLIRQMVWSGLLAVPVLSIQPLSSLFYWSSGPTSGILGTLFTSIVMSFALGATAGGIYEALLRHHFSPVPTPSRSQLAWLIIGPVVLTGMKIIGFPLIWSLAAGLIAEIATLVIIRPDLIWDAFFSAVMMGLLYVLAFVISFTKTPVDPLSIWFTTTASTITLWGINIQEIILVACFGGLWGPIYVAVKDLDDLE